MSSSNMEPIRNGIITHSSHRPILTGPMSCSRIHHFGHYIWSQFLRCSLTLKTMEVLREHELPLLESKVFLIIRPDLWVHEKITKVGLHLVTA